MGVRAHSHVPRFSASGSETGIWSSALGRVETQREAPELQPTPSRRKWGDPPEVGQGQGEGRGALYPWTESAKA